MLSVHYTVHSFGPTHYTRSLQVFQIRRCFCLCPSVLLNCLVFSAIPTTIAFLFLAFHLIRNFVQCHSLRNLVNILNPWIITLFALYLFGKLLETLIDAELSDFTRPSLG